jgi:hypothetical protein
MRSWLLVETLLVLLSADAIVWFVVAMGWPQLLPLPTLAAASRMGAAKTGGSPAAS